jgi:hypothetical protein
MGIGAYKLSSKYDEAKKDRAQASRHAPSSIIEVVFLHFVDEAIRIASVIRRHCCPNPRVSNVIVVTEHSARPRTMKETANAIHSVGLCER